MLPGFLGGGVSEYCLYKNTVAVACRHPEEAGGGWCVGGLLPAEAFEFYLGTEFSQVGR